MDSHFAYYKLSSWWKATFSASERAYIERTHKPMIGVEISTGSDAVSGGEIVWTNASAANYLIGVASWFQGKSDRHIAVRLLEKARELAESTSQILDLHFALMQQMKLAYTNRNSDPAALGKAVELCEQMISCSADAAKQFRRQFKGSPLPSHPGYKQLSIIREKQGDLHEAIRLSRAALKQGWSGDWKQRISRLETKLKRRERN